jgi:hypothetical protein
MTRHARNTDSRIVASLLPTCFAHPIAITHVSRLAAANVTTLIFAFTVLFTPCALRTAMASADTDEMREVKQDIKEVKEDLKGVKDAIKATKDSHVLERLFKDKERAETRLNTLELQKLELLKHGSASDSGNFCSCSCS